MNGAKTEHLLSIELIFPLLVASIFPKFVTYPIQVTMAFVAAVNLKGPVYMWWPGPPK